MTSIPVDEVLPLRTTTPAPHGRRRRRTPAQRLGRFGQYTALLLYMVFLAFPLLWMLSTSFKSPRELASINPTVIPRQPTLDNYRVAFTTQHLGRAALNTLQVSVGAAVLTTIVALPTAYALVRYRGLIQKVALGWILVSQIFPIILLVVPMFLILNTFHLTNNLIGLIIAYIVFALPFALWMLQGYVRGIPRELEEAAAVDGAGKIRVLVSVVAPLLVPGLVVTSLFSFILAWNEFFLALVLLQSPDLATLSLTLARFVGAEGAVALGPLAAGALLATLPSLLIFAVIQRRLTSGLLAGAVKG